jgi:ring-1,2-phenylacetyl-CoA epoxidase subunit PaaD
MRPEAEGSGYRTIRPTLERIWAWLGEVLDPEIPVVSIVELGIVRDIAWSGGEDAECVVTVTPTYSGCPATEVIGSLIRETLAQHGVESMRLDVQLSPAWTTDWLADTAKERLRQYGIAPPIGRAATTDFAILHDAPMLRIACPQCGSANTERLSQFGSTPCKALYRCVDCREPFDYFKCH